MENNHPPIQPIHPPTGVSKKRVYKPGHLHAYSRPTRQSNGMTARVVEREKGELFTHRCVIHQEIG